MPKDRLFEHSVAHAKTYRRADFTEIRNHDEGGKQMKVKSYVKNLERKTFVDKDFLDSQLPASRREFFREN